MTNTMSTQELEAILSDRESHDCDYEDNCTTCIYLLKVERELDARDLWTSDDDRVRESVGNYNASTITMGA